MKTRQQTGDTIRDLRLGLGLTQSALGEAAELSTPAVCLIERGSRGVSLEEGVRIAAALGVTLEALTGTT